MNMKQNRIALIWVLAVTLGIIALSATPQEELKAHNVTEITLTRTSGPAPPTTDVIVLRPEGAQSLATYRFQQLAQWLVAKGFFDMKDRYGGPEPHDCDAIVMSAVRDGRRKTVVNYCGGSNAETWEIEMMTRGVDADIKRWRNHQPWQSIARAAYNRNTSVSSLTLKSDQLRQSGQPRKFKFVNLWRYDVDKQQWMKMKRREDQLVVLDPRTEQVDKELVRLTDKIGLFWAQWEEDQRPLSTLVFAGPILCNDIMIGEPPQGMIPTCVPFPDHAKAMFVPDPKIHSH
jgi:hypothetical protein